MKKRILAVVLTVLFLIISTSIYPEAKKAYKEYKAKKAGYSKDFGRLSAEQKKERTEIYGVFEKKTKLSRKDIETITAKKYSPYNSFVMLRLAKEAKVDIKELIDMKDHGLTWGEMSEELGMDYPKFLKKIEKEIIKYNIIFPMPSEEEGHRDSENVRSRG